MTYWRPIPMSDPARPDGALILAGGWLWFDRVERISRGEPSQILPAAAAPGDVLARLTAPRPAIAGLTMDQPRIMAILNVTPDSFSDGGRHQDPAAALAAARVMAAEGADILDIGGESTRPGAVEVPVDLEIARTAPAVAAISAAMALPISIDTRKAAVAAAALNAGAAVVNDVAGLTFDPAMADLVADSAAPLILMHAQGAPANMQDDPRYDDALLDVYDWLQAAVAGAEARGVARSRIVVDPGIGFGKALRHNLRLLQGLSLFHGLGCPVLLGASRKSFIGAITKAEATGERLPGSLAVALHGAAQGMQFLRVHDIKATRQALDMVQALGG